MGLDGEPVGGELGHQTVWLRREQLIAEQVAQPVELGPQGRGAAVLLVEHGELVHGPTPRHRGQQQEISLGRD
jgi:hypothetical protein